MKYLRLNLTILSIFILLSGCNRNNNEVVIYCAHDRIYSEPILKDFEKETGIQVRAVYDTELTKTVGLVNRIIAESFNPRCDVFWNNEISRTITLKKKKLLTPYDSPNANSIPPSFKDHEYYWAGFAARARIIIYNKSKFLNHSLPTSIFDLTDTIWRGKAAIAYPLFGTTATHAAALFIAMGNDQAGKYFKGIRDNNIGIVDGNATVRDQVVSGEFWWGLTDTDDANGAIENGYNVGIIYPDQDTDQPGVLVIPNTVSIINGAPHLENAKRLVDFILSPEVEGRLAFSRSAQIPLHPDVPFPDNVMNLKNYKIMQTDFEQVSLKLESSSLYLQEIFIR